MRIAIGSDQNTDLTEAIIFDLESRGIELNRFGALIDNRQGNWPLVAENVARDVSEGSASQGILFCYTGTGVSIVANKFAGVRAALCVDAETARGARMWNDANVLCMSIRLTSIEVGYEIVDHWLSTIQIDESEKSNIEKIANLDRRLQ